MGFVSNSLNFRGLGYQGKHQIYFLFGPFDFGHLPTKKCVPFTNTSRSCAAICDVWNKHKRVCLKLEYPQISWMRWVSCSPFKLQLWGMRYTGIPTFRHTQIRLGQLLLDAEGVQLGRRGALSPAMGPLDKSTCCVFSGNCLKNVGRSTSSEQPGLLMSSPTKLGGLRVWETLSDSWVVDHNLSFDWLSQGCESRPPVDQLGNFIQPEWQWHTLAISPMHHLKI